MAIVIARLRALAASGAIVFVATAVIIIFHPGSGQNFWNWMKRGEISCWTRLCAADQREVSQPAFVAAWRKRRNNAEGCLRGSRSIVAEISPAAA